MNGSIGRLLEIGTDTLLHCIILLIFRTNCCNINRFQIEMR